MIRNLWLMSVVLFAACKPPATSDPTTSDPWVKKPDGSANRAPVATTWRIDAPRTRIEDVAIDGRGRVAVVGQRLVGVGAAARSSVFVTVYQVDGAVVWTQTLEGQRWQQAAAIVATERRIVVALRSGDAGDDRSQVVAFGPDGGAPFWRFHRDLATREYPQDLVLDGGRFVLAVVTPSASTASEDDELGSVALWLDPRTGQLLAEAKLQAEVTTASHTPDGVAFFTFDEYSSHQTVVGAEHGVAGEHDLILEEAWGSAATSDGDVVVVGRSADAEPVVRVAPDGSARWASGYNAFDQMVPNAVAVGPDGLIYAAGGAEWAALDADGETVISSKLGDRDSVTAVAAGPGGDVVLVGFRNDDAYGSTVGFVVRLDAPQTRVPLPSTRSSGKLSTGEFPIATRLRWLESPRAGQEFPLPTDRATRREAAKALLAGDLACTPRLVESIVDESVYGPRPPGPLATLDDACLRVASVVPLLSTLERDDLPDVREGLRALLRLHGDDVDEGEVVGRAVLDAAASSDYLEDLTRLALDAPSAAVREHAVAVLEDRAGPRATKTLELFFEHADCVTAMRAALALKARGSSIDLASRPPGANAGQLYRRYCLLRNHPDPKLASAYWKRLVGPSGCYERVTTCAGSWPVDSELLEPCEDDTARICSAPGWDANDVYPTCGHDSCQIGSERSTENFDVGWDATLHFGEARDGELYVDTLEVEHWIQ